MSVRICVVCFTALVFFPILSTPASASPQAVAISTDTQILDTLRSIRDQLIRLKTEIDAKAASPDRPDQRNMDFARYRATFETYQGKIGDLYRQLTAAYDQVSRVYRTNPNSPAYKSMVALYLDAKREYDAVSAAFGTIQPPEKLQSIATVSEDNRLNRQVATTIKAKKSAAPETTADIIAVEESRFIGTFDNVEMFLQIKGDNAYYIFMGWKDVNTDESGRRNETVHSSVLRSEFFPKQDLAQIQTNQQHLEKALKLNFLLIETKEIEQTDLNRFFTRIKSYTRGS